MMNKSPSACPWCLTAEFVFVTQDNKEQVFWVQCKGYSGQDHYVRGPERKSSVGAIAAWNRRDLN